MISNEQSVPKDTAPVNLTPGQRKFLNSLPRNLYENPIRGRTKTTVSQLYSMGMIETRGMMAHQKTMYITPAGRAALTAPGGTAETVVDVPSADELELLCDMRAYDEPFERAQKNGKLDLFSSLEKRGYLLSYTQASGGQAWSLSSKGMSTAYKYEHSVPAQPASDATPLDDERVEPTGPTKTITIVVPSCSRCLRDKNRVVWMKFDGTVSQPWNNVFYEKWCCPECRINLRQPDQQLAAALGDGGEA